MRKASAPGFLFSISTLLALLFVIAVVPLKAEVIPTTIVGFKLDGEKPNYRLMIGDLEIFMPSDTQRFVPMKRLATELGLIVTEPKDSLVIEWRGVERISVCLNDGVILSGEYEPYATEFHYGASDFTGTVDLFLPDVEVAALLKLEMNWDEIAYAYLGKSTSVYPVWATDAAARSGRGKSKRRQKSKLEEAISQLPESIPTGPSRLGDPALHMLRPGIRASQANKDYLQMQKTLGAWGRLGGGRYSLMIRQSGRDFEEEPILDRVGITHRIGDMETTLGDVQITFSNLMYPSASAVGMHATGLLGMSQSDRERDDTNFGRRTLFTYRERASGLAALGSTVELYVNGDYVTEQIVSVPLDTDSATGRYLFEEIAVTKDRVTELRVVITQPDGTVIEEISEPAGTSELIGRGQLLFGALGGARRFTTPRFWKTQGQIGGGRMIFGLAPFWSVGGGYMSQSEHGVPFDLDVALQDSTARRTTIIPRESRHGLLESRMRFLRAHTLSAEFGFAETRVDPNLLPRAIEDTVAIPSIPYSEVEWGEKRFAGRAEMKLFFGKWLRLEPTLLHYDSGYYNGSNAELQDREGYAVNARFEFTRRLRFNFTHGEIWDNIEESSTRTVHQSWSYLSFPVPRVLPRSNIRVSGNRFQETFRYPGNADTTFAARYLGKVEITSTLLRVAELTGNIAAGDELQERRAKDLLRGLNLPNTSSTARPSWFVQLSRKLMQQGRLALQHSSSEFRELTRFSHTLQASETNHWHWRHETGYDWTAESYYFQFQPEYYFERTGSNRLSAFARYLDNEWIFSVGLRLEPVISFSGGRPYLIPASRINPTNGGIKGRVFTDGNGNGHLDPGETGVEGIEVVGDGGRKAVSGRHGEFLLPGNSQRRQMRVSLNPLNLPVDYTATGGSQRGRLEPGNLTPIRLGITKLGSITGIVYAPDVSDSAALVPMGSVRVICRDDSGNVVQESITYSDGSYFLADMKPGVYSIEVDGATIPKENLPCDPRMGITVGSGTDEELNRTGIDLMLGLRAEEK